MRCILLDSPSQEEQMHEGRLVFSQIMDVVPKHAFRRCVNRYQGNYRVRRFTCWDQFPVMIFAQLTFCESLRDIETCLRAFRKKLYHAGIRARVSRNTLAVANERRDWRIHADFAQALIHDARHLYRDAPFGAELEETVYALDSTTIELCLSLFPWARFRTHKGGVKLHTLLDLHGNIPSFIQITPAAPHDVNVLDVLVPERGALYVMDRGYVDYARLHRFTRCMAGFVIRPSETWPVGAATRTGWTAPRD